MGLIKELSYLVDKIHHFSNGALHPLITFSKMAFELVVLFALGVLMLLKDNKPANESKDFNVKNDGQNDKGKVAPVRSTNMDVPLSKIERSNAMDVHEKERKL